MARGNLITIGKDSADYYVILYCNRQIGRSVQLLHHAQEIRDWLLTAMDDLQEGWEAK